MLVQMLEGIEGGNFGFYQKSVLGQLDGVEVDVINLV